MEETGPLDLNLETVRSFIISRGGRVTNHELVKHFKDALTHPQKREEARNQFKEIVNTLATITRNPEGEKHLVLKKKFRPQTLAFSSPLTSPEPSYTPVYQQTSPLHASKTPPIWPDLSRRLSQDSIQSSTSSLLFTPLREPDPPPVPPRRRSSEKLKMENKENEVAVRPAPPPLEEEMSPPPPKKEETPPKSGVLLTPKMSVTPKLHSRPTTPQHEKTDKHVEDSKISVKECLQKFNKLASESALHKVPMPSKKRHEKADRDEEDGGSVSLMDSKTREWLVKCAQSDYQALAKMASENPRLVKFRDPTCGYTALHWAAKHGNEEVVKLIAGTYKADVNLRSNGGYTALHIAMMYGHQDVYNLLVQTYLADHNLRDWSGKKPRQYLTNKDTTVSADTFRKIKARKKHAAEKDLGFLRMGSLNVRVKRTTEAFSHFLGVGNNEKLHKTWGSADNLPQEDVKRMPPPKTAPIKKRKSKRGQDFTTSQRQKKPINTLQPLAHDSDSDTAAGFGSSWQSTV